MLERSAITAIVESSDDAIISKDLNGVITSWNKGAERLFGYVAAEAIGKSITILIPKERHNEEVDILARIRRGDRIDHYETVRMRKDGTFVEISLTVSPIKDDQGTIIGASKIARNITERKRIEAQQLALYELVARINRSETLSEIYEAAIEAICRCHNSERIAILLCDSDGRMRFKAWRGLSETYRQAVEGYCPWRRDDTDPQPICIDDLDKTSLELPVRKAIEREGIHSLIFIPITYEKRLLGKFVTYLNAPHQFTPEEIRPVQTIASQIAFALERQKSNEALERLVNERTTLLREAISQLEAFSYSVSHDLRAPVRAMQGYAEAILEDYGNRLDTEGREYLNRIIRSGSRMDRLIQDVLTYSRVNRCEMDLEAISLDKLVHEIIQQNSEMQPPQAEITISEHLLSVHANQPALSQVIFNLLSNAVKFVVPGTTPKIQIRAEKYGNEVRLSIQDHGIGIMPEYQERIFGVFERINSGEKYEGTGIGLAIVKKVIERMGGKTGVESDGQTGSTFWIELPAAKNS